MSADKKYEDQHPAFPRLFAPMTVGSLVLRNRVVMLPMGSRMSQDGTVAASESEWLAARARGGVGLVVTGGQLGAPSAVIPAWADGRPGNVHGLVEAFRETALESQRRHVQKVHEAGVPIIGQLLHSGRDLSRNAPQSALTTPVSPSGLPTPGGTGAAHELTEAEIADLVEHFAESARLLHCAGYDGVELHAAHGYLLAQFLSPMANRRHDRYGAGTVQDQVRVLAEILLAIRTRCPDDFVVGVRLSATEQVPGGLQVDDTRRIVECLEQTGLIQYLSLTVGIRGNYIKDASVQPGVAEQEIAAVKAHTSLPVVLAGRITSPEVAEGILSRGSADLIGLGRALVADANFAAKALAGHRIRPCIGFVQDCRQGTGGIACGVNATASREIIWSDSRYPRNRSAARIAIVGGGAAGLEAARLAAEFGHEVLLFEEQDRLGGQLLLASNAPARAEMSAIVDYLKAEVRLLKVEVRLGRRATAAELAGLGADLVVLATGAVPPAPSFPDAVVPVIRPWDVLREPTAYRGRRALVADDGTGFWPTISAAEVLAQNDCQVTIATPNAAIGANIPVESASHMHRRLRTRGVQYRPFEALESVSGSTAILHDVMSGRRSEINADVIIVQTVSEPVRDLVDQIADFPAEIIGDCWAPRRLSNAIFDANRVIRKFCSNGASSVVE